MAAVLCAIRVPEIRWSGGCFAAECHRPAHWRRATVNAKWARAIDTNTFGTDEFMDLVDQIGRMPMSVPTLA